MIEKLADALEKKAGFKKRKFYPVFPLKEGYYCRVAAGIEEPKPMILEHEKGFRLLEEPIDPLTDYGKKLVLYFTKGKGLDDVSCLKAFLVQDCGVANPEGYTWKDILSALEHYRESKQITQEAVLQGIDTKEPDRITLKRSDFGKSKSKAMKLLEDLEGKRPGEKVKLDKDRHGADAVKTLQRACPELAGQISKKGNTVTTKTIIKLEA